MTAAGASQSRALALIAGLILLLFLAAFFPGFLSADSVVMLNYAFGNIPQTNWHPPFGVELWRLIVSLVQHIELLWVVQISAFIGATVWLARSYQSRWVVLLAPPLLLLFPPIASNLPGIWKDCWALLFLLLSFAALRHYQQQRSRQNFVLTLIFAALASAVRIDYAAMALLLVLALGLRTADLPAVNWTRRAGGFALPLILFLTLLSGLLGLGNRDVQIRLHPWLTVAIWDMAGISQQGGTVEYPAFLQDGLDLPALIDERYNCRTSDFLVYTKGALPFNLPGREPVVDPAAEASLKGFWLQAIAANPGAYLQHRLCIADQFFGWGDTEVHYVYPAGTIANPFGLSFERSSLHRWVYPIFKAESEGWMFRYWIHLLLAAIAVIALLLLKRPSALGLVLMLTLLACAARVLVLPATDFRYGLWMALGMLLLWLELLDGLVARVGQVKTSHE